MTHSLSLSDFDFAYPERLVAQEPCGDRDGSRLLVRAPGGALRHGHVGDLTSELPRDALLILNDSRVFPSRLFGTLASGGRIELFLLEPLPADGSGKARWRALGRPLRKLKEGTTVTFANGRSLHVERNDETTVNVAFDCDGEELVRWLETHGYIPLPPYIKRDDARPAAESPDLERYQTVYAGTEKGSVAAPTAGLHFTPRLMAALKDRGVEIRYVRLHVGGGTFLPVKTEAIHEHKMHSERALVPRETLDALLAARNAGRSVVAVGTTSFRCLEDLYRRASGDPDRMRGLAGDWHATDLFVRPETADDRYAPWVVDGLVTNFHQPKSTLFMLIAALLGLAEARRVYAEAIAREYRLYSYGDASLLWLDKGGAIRPASS